MMLKRLWSPTHLFEPIRFHEGLNLIVGRYSQSANVTNRAGINGIGKSTVVRLLDYLLLSDQQKKRFTGRKYGFLAQEGHSVVLELSVGENQITIRRTFGKDAKIVGLTVNDQREIQLEDREARGILGPILFPPSLGLAGMDGKMRSLLPFYIKDDLSAHDRVDPVKFLVHAGATERSMTILTLYLLGLPNESLFQLEELRNKYDTEATLQKSLRTRIETEAGKSIAALRTELTRADKRMADLTTALQNFNLFENFKDVSAALGTLEAQAAEQRKAIEQSQRQLAKIRRFVEIAPEIDRNEVAHQYRQISEALGIAVRKTLDDVFAFRDSLVHQRHRFHDKRLVELEALHTNSIENLTRIEEKRTTLMRAVETTRFEESFQDAFQRLLTDRSILERERLLLDQLQQYEQQLSNMALSMQEYQHDALLRLAEVESVIQSIRERFVEIVQDAIATSVSELEDAYLDIFGQTGVAARKLPIKISVSLPRADALGQSRLRLVAYDFTVFLHQVENQLPRPRFLVHDGAFHSIARRTVVKTLNYMFGRANMARTNGTSFQYIATFNEDELAFAQDELSRDGSYQFDIEDVTIVKLGDAVNETLFRRSF